MKNTKISKIQTCWLRGQGSEKLCPFLNRNRSLHVQRVGWDLPVTSHGIFWFLNIQFQTPAWHKKMLKYKPETMTSMSSLSHQLQFKSPSWKTLYIGTVHLPVELPLHQQLQQQPNQSHCFCYPIVAILRLYRIQNHGNSGSSIATWSSLMVESHCANRSQSPWTNAAWRI